MFQIDMQVRDYECDSQGIVNNAIYQHYFEHARHQFLLAKGGNFIELTQSGILLVLYRAEIDYVMSLSSNDYFKVSVTCVPVSKVRCQFQQQIIKDNTVYTKAIFDVTAMDKNKKIIRLDRISGLNLYDKL